MSSLYRNQLEAWLKKIDIKCESCLDVGGGQYNISKRVNSFDVKEYRILDNDTQYKPDFFADLNYPLEETNINGYFYSFDILFCLEVAEYIWSPLQFHRNLFSVLKPGGIAYISYPTLYPLHNPSGIDYLRYTKNAIEKLLSVVGFKKWEITPRVATSGREALSSFYSLEQMRPMKGTLEVFDIGYLVRAIK